MRRPLLALTLSALALAPAGCVENTAPGNDREAALDAPAPGATMGRSATILAGVSASLLQPQILTDADMANVPEMPNRCLFRMTRVGFPVAVYGPAAVIKLNDQLVPLPGMGDGAYMDRGVSMTIRWLDEDPGAGELAPAELVLWFHSEPNELGFHGFAECAGAGSGSG